MITGSANPAFANVSKPEVLSPTFPLQWHGCDGVQQLGTTDQLNYQVPSTHRLHPDFYRQLQEPLYYRQHPSPSDTPDPLPALDTIRAVPSYHGRCHDDRYRHFRSPSTSGSGFGQPVSVTEVADNIQQQNPIALSTSTPGSLEGYHPLSILSDL